MTGLAMEPSDTEVFPRSAFSRVPPDTPCEIGGTRLR